MRGPLLPPHLALGNVRRRPPGRLAQWESAPLTPGRPVVRTHYRPRSDHLQPPVIRPPEPSSSRRSSARAAVVATLLAAVALAGCGLEVSAPAADRDASRAPAPPAAAPPVRETARAEVAGLQGTLDAIAGAFRDGDPDVVLAHVDEPDGDLGRRWAERARNLAAVPLEHYELEHDDTVPDLATASVRGEHGDEALVVRVRERLALAGFDDEGPAVHDHFLTIVPEGGGDGWLVVSDRHAQPLGLTSARHLWDDGPVEATERGSFLALHAPEQAGVAAEILEDAEAALGDVRERWSLEWSERVPIIVPTDEEQLARLLNVTFDLTNFVAFATATVDGELGAYELTGSRVVVNPERFLDRDRAARRRILAHELLHVATRPVAGPVTPIWMEEGVAQRLGEGTPPAGTAARVGSAAASGGVDLPTDPEFTAGGRDRVLLSYAVSYSFLDHLVQRFGEDAVARFYAEVGEASVGEPGRRDHHVRRAARAALGSDIDDLREEWARSLRGG